jgi:hypothetical protein
MAASSRTAVVGSSRSECLLRVNCRPSAPSKIPSAFCLKRDIRRQTYGSKAGRGDLNDANDTALKTKGNSEKQTTRPTPSRVVCNAEKANEINGASFASTENRERAEDMPFDAKNVTECF